MSLYALILCIDFVVFYLLIFFVLSLVVIIFVFFIVFVEKVQYMERGFMYWKKIAFGCSWWYLLAFIYVLAGSYLCISMRWFWLFLAIFQGFPNNGKGWGEGNFFPPVEGESDILLGGDFFTQWKELEECFWLFEWNDLFPGEKPWLGTTTSTKKSKVSYKLFKTEMSLIHERSLDKYCISQASTRVKKLHYKTKSNTKENQLSMVKTVSLFWLNQFG